MTEEKKLKNRTLFFYGLTDMPVMMSMPTSGEVWRGGSILDPHSGTTYDCELHLDGDGNLDVKGSLLFFSKTKVWEPAGASDS